MLRYGEYNGVGVYLIDAPHLYAREGNPYHDCYYNDYGDNYKRFALLGWVGAELSTGLDVGGVRMWFMLMIGMQAYVLLIYLIKVVQQNPYLRSII